MTLARRTATLLDTIRRLEAHAADEALDLFELLYATKVDTKAERSSAKDRLAVVARLARCCCSPGCGGAGADGPGQAESAGWADGGPTDLAATIGPVLAWMHRPSPEG